MALAQWPRKKSHPRILSAVLLMCCFTSSFSGSLQDSFNNYFASLNKDFGRLAANTAHKNMRSKSTNGMFVAFLKKHQPCSYLAKINQRGKIVNEVIRGEVPKKTVNRKVGDAEWYTSTVKSKKPYQGFVEDNGRYFLVWTVPVLSKKKFVGVVVSKIDIWDCFHKLSNETPAPFLVQLGQKSLYSNKWKNEGEFSEDTLSVPGAEQISLLSEKPLAAARAAETLAASVRRDTASLTQPAGSSQSISSSQPNAAASEKSMKKPAGKAKHRTVVIAIAVVVVLVLLFFIFRLYVWLNHKFLMRAINKPD
ncbi:MAG TPA: hypothetical protein VKF42_09095 [Chitinivibrionales bacterium]|nr:hypothetical protein [Chitinivibrionales bacterium]